MRCPLDELALTDRFARLPHLATQDAVATANLLTDKLLRCQRDGIPFADDTLAAVRARRHLPAAVTARASCPP